MHISTGRATAAMLGGRTAPLLLRAGGPRIAETARRGTKPQTLRTRAFRSASLPYPADPGDAPLLCCRYLCNPTAPAPGYQPGRALPASTTPLVPQLGAPQGASPLSALSLSPDIVP